VPGGSWPDLPDRPSIACCRSGKVAECHERQQPTLDSIDRCNTCFSDFKHAVRAKLCEIKPEITRAYAMSSKRVTAPGRLREPIGFNTENVADPRHLESRLVQFAHVGTGLRGVLLSSRRLFSGSVKRRSCLPSLMRRISNSTGVGPWGNAD